MNSEPSRSVTAWRLRIVIGKTNIERFRILTAVCRAHRLDNRAGAHQLDDVLHRQPGSFVWIKIEPADQRSSSVRLITCCRSALRRSSVFTGHRGLDIRVWHLLRNDLNQRLRLILVG